MYLTVLFDLRVHISDIMGHLVQLLQEQLAFYQVHFSLALLIPVKVHHFGLQDAAALLEHGIPALIDIKKTTDTYRIFGTTRRIIGR
jgi:hypothetical protein